MGNGEECAGRKEGMDGEGKVERSDGKLYSTSASVLSGNFLHYCQFHPIIFKRCANIINHTAIKLSFKNSEQKINI